MRFDVIGCGSHKLRIVFKSTESPIAKPAQELSTASSVVVVICYQLARGALNERFLISRHTAQETLTVLLSKGFQVV
jgi:hypothetical protein